MEFLKVDQIYHGLAEDLLKKIEPNSIALSVWSPPYHVGKKYEAEQTYQQWFEMLETVIDEHYRILKEGGFLAININDILCFKDPDMPKFQAETISGRRLKITKEDVLKAKEKHPEFNRYQLAELLGCSEQTIDRRLNGNNIRGGKYSTQTRVKNVGGILEELSLKAGLYLYDRRIWVKDAAWANSNWTSNSYRSVDEFEYIYIFWKPGITTVNKAKLSSEEWAEWGNRGVWYMRSVSKNDDHEAKFPLELPRRLVRLLTEKNDVVLDCFMGSGTSAQAAILENRHFLGIEKNLEYVALSRKKLNAIQLDMNSIDKPS